MKTARDKATDHERDVAVTRAFFKVARIASCPANRRIIKATFGTWTRQELAEIY